MTSSIGFKKWLVLFSVILISVTASLITANYFIDYYGLFRDVEEKKLIPYDNFRLAKYLYSYNYIPVNYDGILIGTSVSMNLDSSKIVNSNVYQTGGVYTIRGRFSCVLPPRLHWTPISSRGWKPSLVAASCRPVCWNGRGSSCWPPPASRTKRSPLS